MSSHPRFARAFNELPRPLSRAGVSSTEALSSSTEPTPLSTGTLCNLWTSLLRRPAGAGMGTHDAGPRADLRPARGRGDPCTVGGPARRRAAEHGSAPRPPTGRTSPSTPVRWSHRGRGGPRPGGAAAARRGPRRCAVAVPRAAEVGADRHVVMDRALLELHAHALGLLGHEVESLTSPGPGCPT